MDQRETTDVLRTFISEYGEAWSAKDVHAIVNAYATPCFVVKGGRALRHSDETAKREYFAELLASNNLHGSHTWSIGDLDVQSLGGDAALVTIRWLATEAINQLFGTSSTRTCLALEEDQWRILGDVVHS